MIELVLNVYRVSEKTAAAIRTCLACTASLQSFVLQSDTAHVDIFWGLARKSSTLKWVVLELDNWRPRRSDEVNDKLDAKMAKAIAKCFAVNQTLVRIHIAASSHAAMGPRSRQAMAIGLAKNKLKSLQVLETDGPVVSHEILEQISRVQRVSLQQGYLQWPSCTP